MCVWGGELEVSGPVVLASFWASAALFCDRRFEASTSPSLLHTIALTYHDNDASS